MVWGAKGYKRTKKSKKVVKKKSNVMNKFKVKY